MTDRTEENIDLQNRHIEQEAQTDTDLETVVPPTSPMWGPTTWWRMGLAALIVILIVAALASSL